MGLLDRLRAIFTRTEKRDGFYEAMTQTFRGNTAGVVVTDESAFNFTAVWAAIRILSESVAQLPLSVYESDKLGNKNQAYNHKIFNLLHRKPNINMTTYTFIQKCMIDLLTRGNSFVFINRGRGGVPVELLPLDVKKVRLVDL